MFNKYREKRNQKKEILDKQQKNRRAKVEESRFNKWYSRITNEDQELSKSRKKPGEKQMKKVIKFVERICKKKRRIMEVYVDQE